MGSTDPDQPNLTGKPELTEWWECVAFGAAKKVYEDRLDPDGVALMDKGLMERYAIAEVRTYAQIGKARIPTLFADQLQQSYGSGAFGFGNSVSGA
jgi:elongation factor P hydroxylase